MHICQKIHSLWYSIHIIFTIVKNKNFQIFFFDLLIFWVSEESFRRKNFGGFQKCFDKPLSIYQDIKLCIRFNSNKCFYYWWLDKFRQKIIDCWIQWWHMDYSWKSEANEIKSSSDFNWFIGHGCWWFFEWSIVSKRKTYLLQVRHL